MTLMKYEPRSLLEQMRREMERSMDTRTAEGSNVATSDCAGRYQKTRTSFKIVADIPGVDPKDIEVHMENGMLTIKGEKESRRRTSAKVASASSAPTAVFIAASAFLIPQMRTRSPPEQPWRTRGDDRQAGKGSSRARSRSTADHRRRAMRRPVCRRATLISRQQASIDGLQRLLCGDGVAREATQDEITVPTASWRANITRTSAKRPTRSAASRIGEACEVPAIPKSAAYDQLGRDWRAGQFRPPPGWDAGFEFSAAVRAVPVVAASRFLREPVRTGWQFPQCRLHPRWSSLVAERTIMPGSRSASRMHSTVPPGTEAAYPGIRCTRPTQ